MMMLCWCRLGAQGARVMWAGADPVADSLQHSGLDEPTKPVREHVARPMPRLVWNCSKRLRPRKASRTRSRLQRSPTTSRARAVEQT
jgi:hypothetical protein